MAEISRLNESEAYQEEIKKIKTEEEVNIKIKIIIKL